MNGAIIGFGQAARHGHWPAYAESRELSIVAVVDRTEERRLLAASLDPALRTYASLEDLAAAETIDFLDICTPPALHHDPMRAALARGWHVVCEKPFVLDPAQLAAVRVTAEARQLAVVPVHNWKFAPIVRDATERLRQGAIGRLERVEVETERLRDFQGADPARPNWRRDPAIAGGGILMDHGWHAVYLVLQWFEALPREIDARFHRPAPDAVEDEADVRLAFACGEATIRLTWNGTIRRNAIRLVGDGGSITIADDRLIVERADNREVVTYPAALSSSSHHADWFAAFVPSIAGYFNHPALSRAVLEEAAACLDIIQRAYLVGRSRCPGPPVPGRRSDV